MDRPPPSALLRSLDLSVRRRIDGLLSGDHRSASLGTGTELAQIRPYVPGDDVRTIDWNATARTGEPHVRAHVAERALTTWIVLDTSASMAWGTQDRSKADVAEGVCLAVGHAASHGVNRVGLVVFGSGPVRHRPPAQGRVGLHAVLDELRQARADHERPAGERPAAGEPGATDDLSPALLRAGRLARSRSLVVVVSDLRGDRSRPWRLPLLALGARHDVIVVEVRDEREQDLPAVGELTLVDPETGRVLRLDTSSAQLRQRFAAAAAEERAEVARAVTSAGAEHVVLTTSGEWLQPLTAFLALRRRTAVAATPAGGQP